MKLITHLNAIAITIIGLTACTQGPGNSAQVPLMKPEKPASPAAAISANTGAMHQGLSTPGQ